MLSASEIRQDLLDSSSRPNNYCLQPSSLLWKINQVVPYFIGSTFFFIGSIYYLPSMADYEISAVLFTIGSVAFLYADVNEWWVNRAGCECDCDKYYRISYDSQEAARNMESEDTMLDSYQRTENELNYALSAFGSLLYLVGSILQIPESNTPTEGGGMYFFGSIIITFSQTWKIYRAGCIDAMDRHKNSFHINNVFTNKATFFIEFNGGLGGFAYFIGCLLYLPGIDEEDQGAIWFVLGAAFFILSAIFLAYHHFGITENEYSHS